VDATYEAFKGRFEITTDTGMESGVLDDDGKLVCTVDVSFEDASGDIAKISVECRDETLAANVQSCLRSVVDASLPVSL
jgi:hypothetical protein